MDLEFIKEKEKAAEEIEENGIIHESSGRWGNIIFEDEGMVIVMNWDEPSKNKRGNSCEYAS